MIIFRKPIPVPDQVGDMLFGIMRGAIVKIAHTCFVRRLAYRPVTVKATWGCSFAAKLRSGKRTRSSIVLPLAIG
jgi:hypothetical protein